MKKIFTSIFLALFALSLVWSKPLNLNIVKDARAVAAVTVSGTIRKMSEPLVGIKVKLVDVRNREVIQTVTTNSQGLYVIPSVADGSFYIVPQNRGYIFSPKRYLIHVVGTPFQGLDFAATPR